MLHGKKIIERSGFCYSPRLISFYSRSNSCFSQVCYIIKATTLSLTDDWKYEIKTLLMNCLHSQHVSIRELARILGNIIASFPAVTFEPLHY